MVEITQSRQPIPWRPVWTLAAGTRKALAGMIVLSLTGSVLGLVPSLALGFFVDAVARGSRGAALLWVGAIGGAFLIEAVAYTLSDGLYARAAARLYRDLRVMMFDGVLRRGFDGERRATLASRFVSDAESMEDLTVAILDQGAISIFDLIAAIVVLGLLDDWLVGVVTAGVAVSVAVLRYLRGPAGAAGEQRQEALEVMSDVLARPASGPESDRRRFLDAVEGISASERRLGWIAAVNRQGSQGLAGISQVAVLLAASFQGGLQAGTLVSVYLLAGRAFGAAETLLDASFEIELARGAVARCFALANAS